MFALPIFEKSHPRWSQNMTNSMIQAGYTDYKYYDNVVIDPEAPVGIVYCHGHNINYELHAAYNEVTDDRHCHIIFDATNKKSVLKRNRKFNKVTHPAYSFIFDESYPKQYKDNYMFDEYGVCDNAEQVMQHYKFLADDPHNNYFIALTPISKEHQPASGGWRWHKWGSYIGTQKRTGCEYLYNEPNIDLVFTYHVYKFKSVLPFLKTEHFTFVKNSKSTLTVFDNTNDLNAFCIDFNEKNVTTWCTAIDSSELHIVLADLPENITFDNIGEWVELNYQPSWL